MIDLSSLNEKSKAAAFDLHIHTTYCDGINTPREMADEAVRLGMSCLGFSGHGYTFFDKSYCMSPPGTEEYISEITSLKREYAGRLKILCGVEQDIYSAAPTDGFDYVIGSVHYLLLGGEYIPVDESADILKCAAKKYFGGDMISLCEEYYRTVSRVAAVTHADIIGHFDLISKFNENGALFDERDARYVRAWRGAADALLPCRVPFELNTGAVSRGYRSRPYPAAEIIEYIRQGGGSFILSSDSHRKETLCFGFTEYEKLIK